MARFIFKVGEEYLLKLSRLQKNADGIIKQAIYDGADIVADEIQKSIDKLPEETFHKLRDGDRFSGVPKTQKLALKRFFGLSEMQKDTIGWNTKAGFAGYMEEGRSKKYPNGLPIPLLARSIESGSTVRQKHPFVRTAVRASRSKAVDAMEQTINKEIQKEMK